MSFSDGTLSVAHPPGPPCPAPRQAVGPAARQPPAICADEILEHIPRLRIYARSLCRDPALADDLVQDTLLRAISSLSQFRPGTNLRAWLFTILRNSFYNAYARRRRESTGSADCVSSIPEGLDEEQIWAITRRETEEALARMPTHYAEALIMVTVLGTSYLETARVLGCDIGTIKSRVNRARNRLRAELGDLFAR